MPSLARLLSPPRQAGVQRLPRPVLKGTPLIVCSTCFKLSRCPPTSPCRPGTVCKLRCRFCSTVLSGVSSGCGRGAASARGRGDGWRRPWFGLRWLAWAGLRGRWWHARDGGGSSDCQARATRTPAARAATAAARARPAVRTEYAAVARQHAVLPGGT